MKNLAIIPARGGSKRIPHKNIKKFLGKPIIAYSIEVAIKSRLFDEVMVSTDDNEIAEIAKQYGAKVPFMRSNESADSFASISDVIKEVKTDYLRVNKKFDNICCILATAPLIKTEYLRKTFSILQDKEIDSVRPIVRFSYPIQRAFKLTKGKVEMFSPQYMNTRSQDLEPAFHDAGQFYWMKYASGLEGSGRYGLEIPESDVQDIDTEEDWKLAEMKYNLIKG